MEKIDLELLKLKVERYICYYLLGVTVILFLSFLVYLFDHYIDVLRFVMVLCVILLLITLIVFAPAFIGWYIWFILKGEKKNEF